MGLTMNSKLSRYGNKRMFLFLLVSAFSVFLLWYFFHPLSPYNERVRYVAAFGEVGPVDNGKNVKVGGLPKGRITHIEKTDSLLYVAFEVESSVRISKDSRLHFASAGFLGNRELEIVLGSSPENYAKGDTIFSTVFDKGLGTAHDDLDESLRHLNAVLDSLRSFFATLDSGKEGAQMKRLAQKGKRISSDASADFVCWKETLDGLFGDLSALGKKLDSALQEVSAGIDSSRTDFSAIIQMLERLRGTVYGLNIQVSEVLDNLDKDDNSTALILQKGGAVSAALKNVQTNIKNLVQDVKKNGVKLNVDFF